MKIYRFIFLLMVLLNCSCRLSAQLASDLFSVYGGKIMTNAMFFSPKTVVAGTNSFPSGTPLYENDKVMVGQCTVAYVNTESYSDFPLYDCIRVYGNGSLLLEQWGYSPIYNVSYITVNEKNEQLCLPVNLGRKTSALIFGGPIFETGNEAPEMMIILVKGNEAKLIFDRPAMVYAYTPEPNFSIEYVEKMDWENYGDTGDYTPNAKTIASQTKHKIWKEGNMLKYKSWK